MDVLNYYRRTIVLKEVSEFLADRWIAVHCMLKLKDGRPMLIRYIRNKPLRVLSQADFLEILKKLAPLKPRTFYGSANLYKRLERREDALNYLENIYARTPTWDIDSRPEWWRATLEVARVIVNFLERKGIARSVYLKWSGRGLHIHVHEHAISEDVYSKVHPIDVAYSLVDYVLTKVRSKINEINIKYSTSIKVENLMDPQRVFTAPLSLHRKLDVVCVAFKPEEIDDFEPSWTQPGNFRHNPRWREYDKGEADELVLKAYRSIGPYPKPGARPRRKHPPLDVQIRKFLEEAAQPVPEHEAILDILKYNPNPAPLTEGRNLRKDSRQAIVFLEDVISHYIQGRLSFEEMVQIISHYKRLVLPALDYPEDVKRNLIELYGSALKVVTQLRKPSKVKAWLLSHGPPRSSESIDKFMKEEENS